MKQKLSQTARVARQRHGSLTRVVCIVLAVGLLIAAPASAQIAGQVVIDDFEDGDLDGWFNSQTFEITSQNPISGNYSAKSTATVDGMEKSFTSKKYEAVSFKYRNNGPLTNTGGGSQHFGFGVRDAGEDNIVLLNIGEDGGLSVNDVAITGLSGDTVYEIGFVFDYQTNNVTVYVNGTEETVPALHPFTDVAEVALAAGNVDTNVVDDIYVYEDSDAFLETSWSVEGTVTDQNDEPVSGATVEIQNSSGDVVTTQTTNDVGAWNTQLLNGTYSAVVTKSGYSTKQKNFTVDGEPTTVNIQIVEERLRLDTRQLFEPGATHDYRVLFQTGDSSGDLEEIDVTATANVTSLDTANLTVDESHKTMTAVDDENVSAIVTVNVTYQSYSAQEEIVVAAPTVENLALIPTGITRTQAILTDDFIFVLLIASFLSVPASRFANAFGGLAVAEMVLVVGWLSGYVPLGMAMLSIFVALFVGLNLAENVNITSVRGSSGGGGFGGRFG